MVARGALFGSFLLFAAFALLLVATISSPVFRQISFLDVYQNGQRTSFGVFGYCVGGNCSPRSLGYDIPGITQNLGGQNWTNDALIRLTRALILHPIACGLAFIAFVIAIFSDRIGYLFSSLITFLAFLVSLVAMAIDFGLFTVVRNHINETNNTNISSNFGNAIWLTLAATVILFFATFVVCFSCCTARRKERYSKASAPYAREAPYTAHPTYAVNTPYVAPGTVQPVRY